MISFLVVKNVVGILVDFVVGIRRLFLMRWGGIMMGMKVAGKWV